MIGTILPGLQHLITNFWRSKSLIILNYYQKFIPCKTIAFVCFGLNIYLVNTFDENIFDNH